jgi:hypothetical protein
MKVGYRAEERRGPRLRTWGTYCAEGSRSQGEMEKLRIATKRVSTHCARNGGGQLRPVYLQLSLDDAAERGVS